MTDESKVLSSEQIKHLMQNMEIEREMLDAARRPLLIMLTDLKNSTIYYDRLGDVAAKSLIFKHNNILFPIIETAEGAVIKTTGDGILATFEDAAKGLKAAARIQSELRDYNDGRDLETSITVRIGLHYGKTIVFENDVYGDSINATARIEGLADGNEILISQSVVEAVQPDDDRLVNIGLVHLKGKLEPMNVYGYLWDHQDSYLKAGYQRKREEYAAQQPAGTSPARISISGGPVFEDKDEGTHRERGNPFLNRSAITQPDYFFGRETLIHKIYSRISAQRPQSVSLYGERRIGKSSLINQLRSLRLRREFLSDINRYIFIHIDVQSMRGATVEHFIDTLYEGVRSCFHGQISFDLKPVYHDFVKLVEELNKADINLIIIFDEFDLITLNPSFDVEFYSWLRSLASHYRVAFITSSLSQLQQLCATKKISDSPFFNIFTAFHVGPFTLQEARGLIGGLLKLSLREYDFSGWEEEIFAQAGYLPFFIQIYCANLFDLYPAGPSPQEVADAFMEEARDHFEHICRNLCAEERECLRLIKAGKSCGPKLESFHQQLIRKGYVIQEGDKARVFSTAFEQFMASRPESQCQKSLWSKLWKK